VPAALGGTPIPASLRWAIAEMVLGSNPAVHMYSSGFAFAHVMYRLGTATSSAWPSTWSSSTGARRWCSPSPTPARRRRRPHEGRSAADGTWHITGVKRFITSAEADFYDNVVHLVLARPEGAGPGTKGLSLFVVPKFHVDLETGTKGARNGAFVTNVEHKMGLKVSTTCELRFGEVDGIPAVGTLLGRRPQRHRPDVQGHRGGADDGRHQGHRHPARPATSTPWTTPKEPGAGARPRADADKAAPRVTITHHPGRAAFADDAEGLRRGAARARALHRLAAGRRLAGRRRAATRRDWPSGLNDLLLPIVKGVGSSARGCCRHREPADVGGSGFLQDYPLEQYVRDAKIDTLYEGTTAIQGHGLLLPQDRRGQGRGAGSTSPAQVA
jgi:alkylation response protein AidB-like acyl-CoA dehydrogenase